MEICLKVLSLQPPACSDHGLHRILSTNWQAHFYLMKKSAKVLLYFGLDCGMLDTDVSPAFLEHGSAERSRFEYMQNMIQTSRRLNSFLHEGAQNFELLSNI
jgi:hypothetical protein